MKNLIISSFWDASFIGGGGGFLCTSRCLGEHEILVVWSHFYFWGSRTQKMSYSLSIISPFLIGAFKNRSLLRPEDSRTIPSSIYRFPILYQNFDFNKKSIVLS